MKFGHYSNEELGIRRNLTCAMFDSKGVGLEQKDVKFANSDDKKAKNAKVQKYMDKVRSQILAYVKSGKLQWDISKVKPERRYEAMCIALRNILSDAHNFKSDWGDTWHAVFNHEGKLADELWGADEAVWEKAYWKLFKDACKAAGDRFSDAELKRLGIKRPKPEDVAGMPLNRYDVTSMDELQPKVPQDWFMSNDMDNDIDDDMDNDIDDDMDNDIDDDMDNDIDDDMDNDIDDDMDNDIDDDMDNDIDELKCANKDAEQVHAWFKQMNGNGRKLSPSEAKKAFNAVKSNPAARKYLDIPEIEKWNAVEYCGDNFVYALLKAIKSSGEQLTRDEEWFIRGYESDLGTAYGDSMAGDPKKRKMSNDIDEAKDVACSRKRSRKMCNEIDKPEDVKCSRRRGRGRNMSNEIDEQKDVKCSRRRGRGRNM